MLFYAEHPPSRLAIEVGLDRCSDLAARILSSFPDRGGEADRAVGSRPSGEARPARSAAMSKSAGGGEPQPAPARAPLTGGHAWSYPAVILAEGLAGC